MILITGASGNVGKEVLKQIARTGVQVRAAFQSVSKATAAPAGVEIVTVDFNQPETLRAALRGVDRVFLVGPPNRTTSRTRAQGHRRHQTVGCLPSSKTLGHGRTRCNISAAACSI